MQPTLRPSCRLLFHLLKSFLTNSMSTFSDTVKYCHTANVLNYVVGAYSNKNMCVACASFERHFIGQVHRQKCSYLQMLIIKFLSFYLQIPMSCRCYRASQLTHTQTHTHTHTHTHKHTHKHTHTHTLTHPHHYCSPSTSPSCPSHSHTHTHTHTSPPSGVSTLQWGRGGVCV